MTQQEINTIISGFEWVKSCVYTFTPDYFDLIITASFHDERMCLSNKNSEGSIRFYFTDNQKEGGLDGMDAKMFFMEKNVKREWFTNLAKSVVVTNRIEGYYER